jgi:CheY-like chemotaxis protein
VLLRFSEQDTGIGISEDQQAQIFAPFAQADASTTRQHGGTGLGLTISRTLVEKLGGEMGLVSTPGQGSEFWFTMPFKRDARTRFADPVMREIDSLVVDDSPVVLDVLRETMRSMGWRTDGASTGQQAIDAVRTMASRHTRRVVFLIDRTLPDIDSLSVVRAILAHPWDHTKVIILMTDARAREAETGAEDAHLVDAILTKPVTASSIYNAVRRAIQRREGHDAEVARTSSARRLAGIRILVVDDSDINREVAERIFSFEGADVAIANDGRQAIDWLLAHPQQVDVVLMDVQMPILDGYAATREIRAIPDLQELPVIALTAGAFKKEQDAAIASGMTDFLSKPFDVDAAVELIARLSRRKPAADVRGATSANLPSADGSASSPAAVSDAGNWPGLAIDRGLRAWGDAAVYRQYLRRFMRDYATVSRDLAQCEPTQASALAHQVRGAAANLAIDDVAQCAGEVERLAVAGLETVAAIAKLGDAMGVAADTIVKYAPDDTMDKAVETVPKPSGDASARRALLARAEVALSRDSPDVIEPMLVELQAWFGPEALAPLVRAVENFDFRAAEAAVRSLAALPVETRDT